MAKVRLSDLATLQNGFALRHQKGRLAPDAASLKSLAFAAVLPGLNSFPR
jgi:hypothetical protein